MFSPIIHENETLLSLRKRFEQIFRENFNKSEFYCIDASAWFENNRESWRTDYESFGYEVPSEAVLYGADAGFVVENIDAWESGWLWVSPVPGASGFLIKREYLEKSLILGYPG